MKGLKALLPRFLAVALSTGAAVAIAGSPAAKSEFWAAREAAYRASPRGPFTAIRADYLRWTEALHLYVAGDSLVTDPGAGRQRGAAATIRFAKAGFAISPVDEKGYRYPTRAGIPITGLEFVGKSAGDEQDYRIGRFRLSFGLQGEELGRVLAYDPDLLAERFHGFVTFPDSDDWRVEARVTEASQDTLNLGTTRGLEKPFIRAARLEFEVGGKACALTGFRSPGETEGALFVPFTDATSGEASYGVGRYLRVMPSPDGSAQIDFNRATNPWCAYSPFYNCVLPPEENRLEVAIRAGERTPEGH
jgi:hypothetical protein